MMSKLYTHLCEITEEKRKAAIKKDAAPSLRFEATLLSTLVSDLTPVGKAREKEGWEPADVDVLKLVKKFADGVRESLVALTGRPGAEADPRVPQLQAECALLNALLAEHQPQQMSSTELEAEINRIIAGLPKDPVPEMGPIMGALKKEFAGRYDATLASTLVKQHLANLPKNPAK